MTGGIYIIVAGKQIIYVGKTTRDFEVRFKEHKRAVEGRAQAYKVHKIIREYKAQGIPVSLIPLYKVTNKVELDTKEKLLIDLLNPIGNQRH